MIVEVPNCQSILRMTSMQQMCEYYSVETATGTPNYPGSLTDLWMNVTHMTFSIQRGVITAK